MKKLGFELIDSQNTTLQIIREMADKFIAEGGTYFNISYSPRYKENEGIFREAVAKRYPRNKYTIADSFPIFISNNENQFECIFDKQLQNCGIEYFDYYFISLFNQEDYKKLQKTDIFNFLERKKAEHKIRHIGISFSGPSELLEQILSEYTETEYVQLSVNYLDWYSDTRLVQCYETATEHKKPVIAVNPTKNGILADIPAEVKKLFETAENKKSVVSWPIRFAATQSNVMIVLPSINDMTQMDDSLSYMMKFKPLNKKGMDIVKNAADIIKAAAKIN